MNDLNFRVDPIALYEHGSKGIEIAIGRHKCEIFRISECGDPKIVLAHLGSSRLRFRIENAISVRDTVVDVSPFEVVQQKFQSVQFLRFPAFSSGERQDFSRSHYRIYWNRSKIQKAAIPGYPSAEFVHSDEMNEDIRIEQVIGDSSGNLF